MEMGNPNEAALWDKGQVYINRGNLIDLPADADADLSLNWEYVGLIAPDQGITETPSSAVTEVDLWNHPPVEKSRNHKNTLTFTAQNTNGLVLWLKYPDSSDQELADGILKVGPPRQAWVAWEVLEGDSFERRITREKAEIRWTGATTKNNQTTENSEFTVPVPPAGILRQVRGEVVSS